MPVAEVCNFGCFWSSNADSEYDYEVPNSLAEQYFKDLEAPSKTLIWFENSAHFPNIEEKDKFDEILINQILPATYI